MSEETKNQQVIRGLRELADYMEAHPDLPQVHFGMVYRSFYNQREEFLTAVRKLGTCKKEYSEHEITAKKTFAGGIYISFCLNRDAVCRKIVTWDCGDASLLKELGLEEAVQA